MLAFGRMVGVRRDEPANAMRKCATVEIGVGKGFLGNGGMMGVLGYYRGVRRRYHA